MTEFNLKLVSRPNDYMLERGKMVYRIRVLAYHEETWH